MEEGKSPMYPRNISSREGMRLPSRERQGFEQTARRTFNSQMNSSQQNFLRTSTNFLDPISSTPDDLMLGSINIAIDETGFIATLKTDILQLQDEINKLDIDGSIRGTNPSEILKKNHIYAMYKFLSKYSNPNTKKQMESKLAHANQCDIESLIKFMSARNGSEGLRKLYKLMTIMDIMLTKLTEYQIVSFLKYDKIHEGIRQQLNLVGVNKNQAMDTGISIGRFQVSQAIIDRMFELYEFISKLQQNDGKGSFITSNTSSSLKSLRTLEDFAKMLKSGEHLGLPGEIIISLLDLIKKDGGGLSVQGHGTARDTTAIKSQKELERMLNYQMGRVKELEKELETQRENYENMMKEKKQSETKDRYKKEEQNLNSDFERRVKNYEEQIENLKIAQKRADNEGARLKEENQRLLSLESKLRDEIATLTQKYQDALSNANEDSSDKKSFHPMDNQNPEYYINLVKDLEKNYADKITQLQNSNEKLEKEGSNLKNENGHLRTEVEDLRVEVSALEKKIDKMHRSKEDTYENALREETEMMKKGFETKIKKLQEEVLNVRRDRTNEFIDLKANLQREREGRELLLRKLQIYTKT